MEENVNVENNQNGAGNRPTFLTVLCILTFIGSGLGVLGGILGLVGSSALATFTPIAGGSIIWAILGLSGSALCLFGAIQMWGLKKQGFMLYVVGSVIGVVISIVSAMTTTAAVSVGREMSDEYADVANAFGGAVNAAAWSGMIFGLVITVAFVLMYNANRKHLVN